MLHLDSLATRVECASIRVPAISKHCCALSLIAGAGNATHLALSGGYECTNVTCTLQPDIYRLSLLTSNVTLNSSEHWAGVTQRYPWVDLVGIPMRMWQPQSLVPITSPTLSLSTLGSPVTPIFAYDGYSLYISDVAGLNVWTTIASTEQDSQVFVHSHVFNPSIGVTYDTAGIAIITSQQANGDYRRFFASRCNVSTQPCEENELSLGCAITPFNHVCEPCITCNASNAEVEFASCGVSAELLPFQTVCAPCQNCSLKGSTLPAAPGTFPPGFDCTKVCPSGDAVTTWNLGATRTEVSITTGVLCGAYVLIVSAYINFMTSAFPAFQRILAAMVQIISGGSVIIYYAAGAILLSIDDPNSNALGVLGIVFNSVAFCTSTVPTLLWGLRNLFKAKETQGEWNGIWMPKVLMMQSSLVQSGDPVLVRRFAQATLLIDLVCKDAAFLVISAASISLGVVRDGRQWGVVVPLVVSILCIVLPFLSCFFVKRVTLNAHTASTSSLTATLVHEVEFTRGQGEDSVNSVNDLHLRVAVINTAASSPTRTSENGEASPVFANSRASHAREGSDSDTESDGSEDEDDGAVRGVPGSFGVILHETVDNRDDFIDVAEQSIDDRSECDNPATVASSMPNQSVRLQHAGSDAEP
jgi:hypothetical protein